VRSIWLATAVPCRGLPQQPADALRSLMSLRRNGWRDIGCEAGADDHIANSFSLHRLVQRWEQYKAVARANAAHGFEQRQPAAAHQLNNASIVLFA
jgi:hypothetical protein